MNTAQIHSPANKQAFMVYLSSANTKPLIAKHMFRDDEKLVFGRRLMIMYMLLQGYTYMQIENQLKCGRNTVSDVKKSLYKNGVDTEKIHTELKQIFSKGVLPNKGVLT
jgi:uncharacterized protein YerC